MRHPGYRETIRSGARLNCAAPAATEDDACSPDEQTRRPDGSGESVKHPGQVRRERGVDRDSLAGRRMIELEA